MANTDEDTSEARKQLRKQYSNLFDQVQALLFHHDPIGINFETNTDEYDPEVGTILPRLRSCTCAQDVCRVAHEEFVRWFGDDAGPRERYSKIGAEIWDLYRRSQSAELGAAPNGGPAQPSDNSGASDGSPSVS